MDFFHRSIDSLVKHRPYTTQYVLEPDSVSCYSRALTQEALHYSVDRGRQTKKMDGRKKEPEILPLYY
jgi:hypothetical protein